MKNKFHITTLCVVVFLQLTIYAQIGIGTTNPHESSIVELHSENKGFLPPRLTKDQRNSITQPSPGLIIYNSTVNCLQSYNGVYWFDHCCPSTVNSSFSDLPILIRINPSDASQYTRINQNGSNSGVEAQIGDYIHSITTSPNNIELSYFPGPSETTHELFRYDLESSPIPYKNKRFITRVSKKSGSQIAKLSYDFPVNYNNEFELFLVGKFDSTANNIVNYASFFSNANSSNQNYSLQLGAGSGSSGCTKDYYRIVYRNSTSGRAICANGDHKVYTNDGELHTFNIVSEDHPDDANKVVISFYIDGILINADSNMDGHIVFDELKLFSNRETDNVSKSSIAELIFCNDILDDSQRKEVNDFLVCKYGEE
jgi:hypothetical protein